MQELLTVLIAWLAINTGLPPAAELPRVALATSAEMAAIRTARLAAAGAPGPGEAGVALAHGEGAFAIYDDAGRTIYLHEDWTGATPADSALLVHELVHHLQNVAGLRFSCAGEREKDAYRAQRAWLALFGRTIEEEFGLDPMTVLVRSNCFW